MKDPKTTTLGVLTILGVLIGAAVNYLKTGVLPDIPTLVTAITVGWGLIAASDSKATGESLPAAYPRPEAYPFRDNLHPSDRSVGSVGCTPPLQRQVPAATNGVPFPPLGTNQQTSPPPNIIAILLLFLLPLALLTGCAQTRAFWSAHGPQVEDTAAILGQRAAIILAETALNSLGGKNFTGSVVTGLRSHEGELVNSGDIARIVALWTPPRSTQWQAFGQQLAAQWAAHPPANAQEAALFLETTAQSLEQTAATAPIPQPTSQPSHAAS